MSDFQVNLTNCDIEPIHIPGQIQSHGFLLVVNAEQKVTYYSENIFSFISGFTENPLNLYIADIEEYFGAAHQSGLISRLLATGHERKTFERTNPVIIEIAEKAYFLIIARIASSFLLEFEPALSSFDLDVQSMMGRSIAEILSYKTITELLKNSAMQVRQIIDFDRVMIYRFAPDGHGEVVAEDKDEFLDSLIGLHYPATDIPKQAKELYKINLTRLIADVYSDTARIFAAANTQVDLDLTHSQLRAVSPIHIQYLKNMGVSSSFSISIKFKDELWGLIACHNYGSKFIDFKSREYAKLIGQILSSALEFRSNEEAMLERDTFKNVLEKLSKQLIESNTIEIALTAKEITLLDIVKSSGAILVHNKKIYKLGRTPSDQQLLELVAWVAKEVSEPTFHTDNLSKVFPEAGDYADSVSGLLVSVLSAKLGDYLLWFRGELTQTIRWAGNPNKPVDVNENGLLNISPRNSFEVWTETVAAVSESWNASDIAAVVKVKEELNYGVNQKADSTRLMNERLRQAYEELESFSYTISHDLKNPIASIKGYTQLLMRDQIVLKRGEQMLQRIADRADQMNLMINAVLDYSRIGRTAMIRREIRCKELVSDIVEDLLFINPVNTVQLTVGDLPSLMGDPIMILQVFSNLIGNAVKYSKNENPAVVHIDGGARDDVVWYSVRDNGMGVADADLQRIFELFNRMENAQEIEGSGVGLAIVKRIVEKHNGKIWAESGLMKGSMFHLQFPLYE